MLTLLNFVQKALIPSRSLNSCRHHRVRRHPLPWHVPHSGLWCRKGDPLEPFSFFLSPALPMLPLFFLPCPLPPFLFCPKPCLKRFPFRPRSRDLKGHSFCYLEFGPFTAPCIPIIGKDYRRPPFDRSQKPAGSDPLLFRAALSIGPFSSSQGKGERPPKSTMLHATLNVGSGDRRLQTIWLS